MSVMKRNKFTVFCGNLLFPPKCVGCRELIKRDIFDPCTVPLCDKCRAKWEREKLERCPDCQLEMTICTCSSGLLQKAGIEEAVKLFNYSVKKRSVGKSAVLYMKKHNSARAFDYFAAQLSYAVKRKSAEYKADEVAVLCVPRSKTSRGEYGFDQSELLAKRLAEKCGFKYITPVIRSNKRVSEQKKSSLSRRVKNIRGVFEIDGNAAESLGNLKCLVLVDDVITSGASMAGCIELLKKHFDGKILCASLGRTGKRNKK